MTVISSPETRVPPQVGITPDTASLQARFRPIFAKIAAGALEREQGRILAREPVAWLREAGFGALRIPVSLGGSGASLTQLFGLITELGTADSNLPQILRAHFAFVEGLLGDQDADRAARWLRLVAGGVLFGAAMAEQDDVTAIATRLSRPAAGEGWLLDGVKYYSTGTIYADWIAAIAAEGEDRVLVAIEADAQGVTRIDDWDGFGQRLTGSGTTRFDAVAVGEDRVLSRGKLAALPSEPFFTVYYQLFHLATLAGIGRAALRDAIAFVQPRTRTFYMPGRSVPREDPVVQRVIGRLGSLAFSAETLAERVARSLDAVFPLWQDGIRQDARYTSVEIEVYEAQQIVLSQVLEATSLLFEVGGASAVSSTRGLDRHWRNARVLGSHNPAGQRERALGDWYLNGVLPADRWRESYARQQEEAAAASAGR